MWQTAPENPNAGKEPKARKPKAVTKEVKEKVGKENKNKKVSKVKQVEGSSSDAEELDVGSSE